MILYRGILNFRWDDAYKLLDEMITQRSSNIHNVIGQMIKGDFDDGSNWQMVEYVFDKLNSEGCGLGTRFYNTLIEALWWLGQKERAGRVLNEATKRGLFPELFRMNKLVWSVDVHRYDWHLALLHSIQNLRKLFFTKFSAVKFVFTLMILQDVDRWCVHSNINLA